jgi:small subunit ribosomal protein S9
MEKEIKEKKVKVAVAPVVAPEVVAEPIKPVVAEPVATDDDLDALPEITEKDLTSQPDKYYEAVGRRKTAVARVRLFTRGEKQFLVNGVPFEKYFTMAEDQQTVTASMRKMKCLDKFKVTVVVSGGGRGAQAEAVRHGTARVLVDFNNNFKKRLRKVGYLTRDPRMRERKKFGLKRARKAPQWAKR